MNPRSLYLAFWAFAIAFALVHLVVPAILAGTAMTAVAARHQAVRFGRRLVDATPEPAPVPAE